MRFSLAERAYFSEEQKVKTDSMPLKILLCSPPIFDFYYSFHRSEPLGLLYIYQALAGIPWLHVDIYDARAGGKSKAVKTPDAFQYLSHIYCKDTSRFSLLHRFKRFGNSFNAIISLINEHGYDVVCISSLFSAYHDDVEALVEKIKTHTGAIVIVGGWAVLNDKTAGEGNADVYVAGDGEHVLKGILQEIHLSKADALQRLPKLIGNDSCTENSLFVHRYPRRANWYSYYGKRIASIICSKGCVYRCTFCSIHSRHRYHRRTIDSIKNEFQYLYSNGVRIINFEDDNFLFESDFASQLLSLMKRYHKMGMRYLCMNGVTASNLNSVIDEAIEAGFLEFNVSLVTSHDELTARYHRPASKEIIQAIAEKSAGKVKVVAFIIAGLPGSTIDECIEDILFLAGLPVIIGFSPLYMIPGVDMFEQMGIPQDRRLCRGSALHSFGNNYTREDIASLWKLCRFINSLKGGAEMMNDEKEMEEHWFYYKKACKERKWYYRTDEGIWHPGFSFNTPLPESFTMCDVWGKKKIIM